MRRYLTATGGESGQRTRIRGHSEHIMRCVLDIHHDGITIGDRRETNLRFADDTTLLCTSKEELQALRKRVKEASKSQHIFLNTQTTKIVVVDKRRERKEDFVRDGEKIEEDASLSTQDPVSTSKVVGHRKAGGGWR